MHTALLASMFFPENFWLMIGLALGGGALVIWLSFWATTHFGGSPAWVLCGMLLGAVIAMMWSVALFVIGVPIGALVGCALSVVFAILSSRSDR